MVARLVIVCQTIGQSVKNDKNHASVNRVRFVRSYAAQYGRVSFFMLRQQSGRRSCCND